MRWRPEEWGGCGNTALLLLHRCFVVFLSSYHAIRARAYVTQRDVTRGAMTTATSIATATVTGLPRSDDGERRAPDPLRSFSRPPSPHETFPTRTFLESLLCSCSVLSFDLDLGRVIEVTV